jgi:hypothetical protein
MSGDAGVAGSSRSINQPATVDPHPFLSVIKAVLRANGVQNRDSLSKSWTGLTRFFRIHKIHPEKTCKSCPIYLRNQIAKIV